MGTKFHYFASTPLAYATAETRAKAIEKAVRHSGHIKTLREWVLNTHKAGEPGVYVWSVKVLGMAEKNYGVEFFAPKGVKTTAGREHYLTHVTAKTMALWHKPKAYSLADREEAA